MSVFGAQTGRSEQKPKESKIDRDVLKDSDNGSHYSGNSGFRMNFSRLQHFWQYIAKNSNLAHLETVKYVNFKFEGKTQDVDEND